MSKNSLKKIVARKSPKKSLTTYEVHGVTIRVDNEDSKEKLTGLIEKLQEIETGRDVVKVLAETKTPLLMESMGNTIGYFSSPDLKIALNYEIPTKKLCSTLVHESHHLMQYLNGGKGFDRFNLDLKSQIMNDRAKEADAQTWAMRACQEWKELGDSEPYEEFKRYYPPIEAAFDKAMRENGGVMDNRVLTETFKGWYNQDGVRTVYENNYMLAPASRDVAGLAAMTPAERAAEMSKEADGIIFYYQDRPDLQTMTPQQIIGMYSSGYFIDDPAVLESPECLGVRPFTKEMMRYVLERNGRDDDTCNDLPETRQGARPDYAYNGYLANLAEEDMKAHFKGNMQEVARRAGVPYKDLKKAVKGNAAVKQQFMQENAGNDVLEASFPRLELLRFETDRLTAFNKAMGYEQQVSANGRRSPMPAPLTNADEKDFDKIKADFIKSEIVCQAGAFILDYASCKPALADALWNAKEVPGDVKDILKNEIFGYLPQSASAEPVTKEDKKALAMVKKYIAAHAKEAEKAEKKSYENQAFREMKTALTNGDEKRFAEVLKAYESGKKPQETNRMLTRLSADDDIKKNKTAVKTIQATRKNGFSKTLDSVLNAKSRFER